MPVIFEILIKLHSAFVKNFALLHPTYISAAKNI